MARLKGGSVWKGRRGLETRDYGEEEKTGKKRDERGCSFKGVKKELGRGIVMRVCQGKEGGNA